MLARRPLFRSLVLAFVLIFSFGWIAPAPAADAATLPVVDDFEAALPINVTDGNGVPIGFFIAQDTNSTTTFARTDAPPAPVPGAGSPNNVLRTDFNVVSYGVVIHFFENAAVNQWITQDWSAYAGLAFWLYGNNSGTDLFVDIIENRPPGSTRDDAERFSLTLKDNFSGWRYIELPFDSFARKEIGNGAPNDGFTLTEVHGWALGALTTATPQTYYLDNVNVYGTAPVRPLTVGFVAGNTDIKEGRTARIGVKLSKPAEAPVTVSYATADGLATAGRDYTPAAGTLTFAPGVTQQSFTVATSDDGKPETDESVLLQLSNPTGADLGLPRIARLNIQDNDMLDPALLDDFETPSYLFKADGATLASKEIRADSPFALPGQGTYERVLQVKRDGGSHSPIEFGRRFAQGQDWRGNQGLSFWFYGNHTGRKIDVNLLDNQASDPGPAGWKLAWSDEFNSRAGTPPNPQTWSYEIGDGTVNGIPGWGNSELEYYTNKRENAATDGHGNLVITVREADGSLRCYYGPCEYTSARLLSKNRFEVAFGRIESRIKVPRGAGLWPAFWSLGTDIDQVGWPQTGEIDFMENVGRLPNRVFGTIHGPGYSGGQSFGGIYDLPNPVADDFHTFTVEWQPGEIRWYVDGIQYHRARPADVAPNQWVFDHPFFMLLNVAVGGNFGGSVGSDTTFPQAMAVDYVRLYQAPDTAERFQGQFTDNFHGWKRITVPFSAFKRSFRQPPGAPNDGLTLSAVNGYGFGLPGGYPTPALVDQVKVQPNCSYNLTVTNTNDSGAGSLRQAIADVCFGGAIGFAHALSGQTIGLTSAELTIKKPVTIDGGAAPGLTISGGGALRAFVVDQNVTASIRNLKVGNSYGFQLAGGILNNGTLTLDRVIIANNQVNTNGEDFWKGGAGIYSGENSTLSLIDSTVSDNTAAQSNGGGVLAYFRTIVRIERSTISGNSANVGGGLRTLGDVQIVNSTIRGNSTYGWMGGAFFHTDGVMHVVNSTIANNSAPAGTTGGAFVGTFTDANATLTLSNSLLAGNSGTQCFYAPWGSGVVTLTSLGHNLVADPSCFPAASDLIVGDAVIGPLAGNGGPAMTHALLEGSPAIDAADAAACPPTDQRGVRRPQGAGATSAHSSAGGRNAALTPCTLSHTGKRGKVSNFSRGTAINRAPAVIRRFVQRLLDRVLALDHALVAVVLWRAGRLLLRIGVLRDLVHGLLQLLGQRAHTTLVLGLNRLAQVFDQALYPVALHRVDLIA